MATNKLLLDVARGLRYRHLPQVVGIEVSIDSLSSIFESLTTVAQQYALINFDVPNDVAALNRDLAGPIGKYGLIDFEYACDANIDSTKTDNVQLLREFGFGPNADRESDDILLLEDDPEYCIRQIRDGIALNQTWLKLFFSTTSVDFGKLDMKTRFRQTTNPALIQFPLDFRCVDACLTNAPFIWFNRHFYI